MKFKDVTSTVGKIVITKIKESTDELKKVQMRIQRNKYSLLD